MRNAGKTTDTVDSVGRNNDAGKNNNARTDDNVKEKSNKKKKIIAGNQKYEKSSSRKNKESGANVPTYVIVYIFDSLCSLSDLPLTIPLILETCNNCVVALES